MNKKLITLTILAGSLALTGLASAQDSDVPPETDVPPVTDLRRPEWLRQLRHDFNEQRQDQLGDLREARRLLRERLANATEEEREEIIREFRRLHRDRIAYERELRKEFRREVHEMRRERRRAVDNSEG
jgi:hypothetical protein